MMSSFLISRRALAVTVIAFLVTLAVALPTWCAATGLW